MSFFTSDLSVDNKSFGWAPECFATSDASKGQPQRLDNCSQYECLETNFAFVVSSKSFKPPSSFPNTDQAHVAREHGLGDVGLHRHRVPRQLDAGESLSNGPTIETSPFQAFQVQNRELHFISNDDKTTAKTLRNTITSRKYRASKVSRIRQLEDALSQQEHETSLWKARAVSLGWNAAKNE